MFNRSYFPEAWAGGFIVPIHKKGDINQVENYRGITLLSTIGKLFTRILNDRLNGWADKYDVYIEAQAGFRKNMGTIDNIFVLHGLIQHFINNKNNFSLLLSILLRLSTIYREMLYGINFLNMVSEVKCLS